MKKSDFKVAFCYNVQPNEDYLSNNEKYAEFDSVETVETIFCSLKELGFNVSKIEFDENFIENLKLISPDFVFNIVEGHRGEDRESQAPAIYEYLGIPYSGSSPMGHALALDKAMAKRVMEYSGVKTAPFKVYTQPVNGSLDWNFEYPAIVKPLHEGSSIGLHNNAVVRTKTELNQQINYVINKHKQPALVEQFIQGREFNQAIIGNENPILFPIVEIDYSYLPDDVEKFSSYEVKTVLDDPESTICPADITENEKNKISEATLGAFRALDIKDYARMDLRMDDEGNVYVLEVNSIPGIAPGALENNSMPKAVKQYGWSYTEMIGAIMKAALNRYGIVLENEK